jgi:hypothetical protein
MVQSIIQSKRTLNICIISLIALSAVTVKADGPGNDSWVRLNLGEFPGTNGMVRSVVRYRGMIYAGGSFTQAGNLNVNSIARWDGTAWSALGRGLHDTIHTPSTVTDLAIDSSGNLFAAGDFDSAGDVVASGVARWDGQLWHSLGTTDLNNLITTLACDSSGNLYAGGDFDSIGGIVSRGIAKWNGSSWEAMNTGMQRMYVSAIVCRSTSSVYVGGYFDTVNTLPIHILAEWDGTTWHSLGTGFPLRQRTSLTSMITALLIGKDGHLYAGGNFDTVGSVATRNIAEWDGTEWKALGPGLTLKSTSGEVQALACNDAGEIFAGGYITESGSNTSIRYCARWNGRYWYAVGSGFDTSAYISSIINAGDGKILAGGSFSNAGGTPAHNIAFWDGLTYSALGAGINGHVRALCTSENGTLYAGGTFTTIGGIRTSQVASWRNGSWSALDTVMGGTICDLMYDNRKDILYAGGGSLFTYKSLTSDQYASFAVFDGTSWTTPGHLAFWNGIGTLCPFDETRIFAGGTNSWGMSNAPGTAIWDGNEWSTLGTALKIASYSRNLHIRASVCDNEGNLYVGGKFDSVGGSYAPNIAKWNGEEWDPVGTGVKGEIFALAVNIDGTLYVAGQIDSAGGRPVNHIAQWDGTSWDTLASGINGEVNALACDDSGYCYAGGYFTQAGDTKASNIARWDGGTWAPIGDGTDHGVFALCVKGARLYVGGLFQTAGGKMTPSIAAVIIKKQDDAIHSGTLISADIAIACRLRGSSLVFTGSTVIDRIMLYSLSGQRLLKTQGGAAINLSGITPQTLIIRVERTGKIIFTGFLVQHFR